MAPNLAYIETKYGVPRRILQRARAKLARLALIEHVSYLNSRYGGQHGCQLSSRFERALRELAEKNAGFKNTGTGSKEKDLMLLELMDARRIVATWMGRQ